VLLAAIIIAVGTHGVKMLQKFHKKYPKSNPKLLTFELVMFYPSYKIGIRRCSMQGYCVKCRTKREMKSAKAITMKNGRPATQGVCPVCGTKMFKIGK
jgi:hypothetical protein